ncbi:MAG: WD40/YVTN/BNR-like repeat-containing protein [Bacteroidales bacterium]
MKRIFFVWLALGTTLSAQQNQSLYSPDTYKGMEIRNIGPAFTSGRIADIAIHPENEHCWYVAVGSGGVWKTENSGVTWTPLFDQQSSYSIGCVTIDPNNPNTVWVGTGENVGGRHVGFGDGVYKSMDGGKSWKNMGLEHSEHISKIIVHPSDPDVVFVAAQGPLWSEGGERGLYKTTDGGVTWKKVLGDDPWTGVTDLVLDPDDPDWIYAATWQRQRTVAAYMGGGPGSGIHRSTDGGESWEKLTSGIPQSNLGKIGLAISSFDRNVVYAAIELDRRKGGIFMSTDRGASWQKQSDVVSGATGPHYYQELYASPHHPGTLYLVDVYVQVSHDHGKTFTRLKEDLKHSDTHSINFRLSDPDYLLLGTDGGIYESFDGAEHWRFIDNLPITQIYKLAVDDTDPFYYIYGGTQDNGSIGGPSRTDQVHGIRNADWFKIFGADGYQTATEPGNPSIVYAEAQEGVMFRIDRITGEAVLIQPQAGVGEPHERFNWDAPILVSPHDPARIYTGSYRVWRSDNRGDSWSVISPDLTRSQDRMDLPIMGTKQSWDNPWDVYAMSNYNTITSLAESPLKEGLLYAGTDDGLFHVSEDGGENWSSLEVGNINGIPATTFVNNIVADLFDETTVYMVLDHHKYGDFKPYLVKSTDRGKSWTSISGDLPERLLIWRLVQDAGDPDLLFAATEFGLYFTPDGGVHWTELTGGMPTIAFRDITIQRRENDLVAASFGRGFFILDDITPLRMVSGDLLLQEGVLFPVKDAWWYVPRSIVSSQGASDYRAKNPPFGAIFTYYLKEEVPTAKELRVKEEKKLVSEGEGIDFPGWEALELESLQEKPSLVFTIRDEEGQVVNHVLTTPKKGINRVSWDLSYSNKRPIPLEAEGDRGRSSSGFMVTPGKFIVSMTLVQNGEQKSLSEEVGFNVVPLHQGALEGPGYETTSEYRKAVDAALAALGRTRMELDRAGKRIAAMKTAYYRMDEEVPGLLDKIYAAEGRYRQLTQAMSGYTTREEVGEKQFPTPAERIYVAVQGLSSTYGPTEMQRETLERGVAELKPIQSELSRLMEAELPAIETELEGAGAPWIEGQD